MKILFVDHVCHRKTRSADFFLDLLREDHEVRVHYYERPYACRLSAEEAKSADLIVFWEFLPGRYRIGVPGKRCVFVPMFDNEWGSVWQWRRIAASGMAVVSFCRAITEHALTCGVRNVIDVRFAFDPSKFEGTSGNPRRALYWDRGDFPESRIRELFAPGAIDELVVQRDFVSEADYASFVAGFGVYIAPRAKEGIGMSFLEQLARGKCVIAHNAPTMNESIVNGQNGLLRDFHQPESSPITAEQIAAIRASVRQEARKAYAIWQNDRERLRAFFAQAEAIKPLRREGGRGLLHFILSCAEYMIWRLCHGK